MQATTQTNSNFTDLNPTSFTLTKNNINDAVIINNMK